MQPSHEIANSIGMRLVLISGGNFTMGSPPSEEGRLEGELQHEVTLSKDFYLGVTAVTQAQYQEVMSNNPSYFQGDTFQGDSSNCPVEQVFWSNAVEFCHRLSELPEEREAGRVYRLPTEAEWEYACRAGSKTAYGFGDSSESLGDYGWFNGNSNGQPHPVAEKKPNAWGLYDMHGNVREWCNDWHGDYPHGAAIDPAGPDIVGMRRQHSRRIVRGGSWYSAAAWCRSASRDGFIPTRCSSLTGFRVALTSPSVSSR